jgi:hypothetical protein
MHVKNAYLHPVFSLNHESWKNCRSKYIRVYEYGNQNIAIRFRYEYQMLTCHYKNKRTRICSYSDTKDSVFKTFMESLELLKVNILSKVKNACFRVNFGHTVYHESQRLRKTLDITLLSLLHIYFI